MQLAAGVGTGIGFRHWFLKLRGLRAPSAHTLGELGPRASYGPGAALQLPLRRRALLQHHAIPSFHSFLPCSGLENFVTVGILNWIISWFVSSRVRVFVCDPFARCLAASLTVSLKNPGSSFLLGLNKPERLQALPADTCGANCRCFSLLS